MAKQSKSEKVPKSMKPTFDTIVALTNSFCLYFRRFLGRIENWSQKSYKNTEIDLDRLGLNQSKKIEAGRSDNEIRIKPQYGQWHQVPFGISSSPHSQRTCQKADA